MEFKKFKGEQKVSLQALQSIGREILIKKMIIDYLKQLPVEALQKLVNFEAINIATLQEKLRTIPPSYEEVRYLESLLHTCLEHQVEIFRTNNIIELEDGNKAGE